MPADTLTDQDQSDSRLYQLLAGLVAVRSGDFSKRLPKDTDPLMNEIASVFNGMNDQLALFTTEVTRVAREVGTEGHLGGQANLPEAVGTWRDLTDSVNAMARNLTSQVRNIAQVATAVASGDLSQQITVAAQGEILELKDTLNSMVGQLSSFADEVTRVAREVGTEGKLGWPLSSRRGLLSCSPDKMTCSGLMPIWKTRLDSSPGRTTTSSSRTLRSSRPGRSSRSARVSWTWRRGISPSSSPTCHTNSARR